MDDDNLEAVDGRNEEVYFSEGYGMSKLPKLNYIVVCNLSALVIESNIEVCCLII